MTTVWMNHWFSTAYNIVSLIKKDNSGFQVIGTNERAESPIRAVCDEWFQEPVCKGQEYLEFCLDFCARHHVDVFMPRRNMVEISKAKSQFEAMGVQVMVDEYRYVDILNRKNEAYALVEKACPGIVPPYFVVTNVDDFKKGYLQIKEVFDQVAFKFVKDEGGKSFRLIDENKKGYAGLFKRQTTRITLDDAIYALAERESFPPLMVMPYLPGDEISVDCLKTRFGTIAIPRFKDTTRIERVFCDEGIIGKCFELLEMFPLEQPCNIQFKYLNDTPYFLEINTRMSGGIHMSCLASGINIPSVAVNKLLGVDKPWNSELVNRAVTQVEIPILL